MARNISFEIKQLKDRKEFDTFWEITKHLKNFEEVIMIIDSSSEFTQQQLLKFIPVNLVATIESFLRSAVKRLIDFGDPYLENSKGFFSGNKLKLDFDLIKSLHKRDFTIGELVSHHTSCNKIEDYLSIMETFIGESLIDRIKKNQLALSKKQIDSRTATFISDYNKIITEISKIYELRHIICHESSHNLILDKKDVIEGYRAVFILIKESRQLISELLEPLYLKSDKAIKHALLNQYNTVSKELHDLVHSVKDLPAFQEEIEVNTEKFILANTCWLSYRDLFLESFSCKAYVDSIEYELFELETLIEITEDRILDIKLFFDIE